MPNKNSLRCLVISMTSMCIHQLKHEVTSKHESQQCLSIPHVVKNRWRSFWLIKRIWRAVNSIPMIQYYADKHTIKHTTTTVNWLSLKWKRGGYEREFGLLQYHDWPKKSAKSFILLCDSSFSSTNHLYPILRAYAPWWLVWKESRRVITTNLLVDISWLD